MATSALTPPRTQENGFETLLEFDDNRSLIDLCGEYDRNLAQIETNLSVQIVRRGNILAVMGEEEPRELACSTLTELYLKLDAGRDIDEGEIAGTIRMGKGNKAQSGKVDARRGDGAFPADQIEMFKGTGSEIKTRKKTIEPRTQAQKTYVESLYNNELAFGIGPAGTGKTYLAVAVGVNMFINGHVDKIILSRPAVEAGERLGFLPGDMGEKVDPYMQPLYDALDDFLPAKLISKLKEEKTIEIAPLAFMRGRTLSRAFVVLDEAQNATTMQMKMFLTRLGEGSRMVITGDRTQIDLPRGMASGLRDAERVLAGVKKVSFNYFTSKDVVRHPLVAAIIEAYEADEAR